MRLALDYLPLDLLVPNELNPKRHDLDSLEAAVTRLGFGVAFITDARTGQLIAGHGRRELLLRMRAEGHPPPAGITEDWNVPVQTGWASKDDDEALAAVVAFNEQEAKGGWNDESLVAVLQRLTKADAGLTGTGFDSDALAELMHHVKAPDLDELFSRLGEPHYDDTYQFIRVAVPQDVYVAWTQAVEKHDGDEVETMRDLLGA